MPYCRPSILFSAAFALWASAVEDVALGQVNAAANVPANALEFDETGTFEGVRAAPGGAIVMFRDSKKDLWLVQVTADAQIAIESQVGADYLRPGQTIELVGDIDEEAAIAEPIAEIVVLDSKSRPTLGLFANAGEEAADADAKPVRNPEAGKYRIRGKLVSNKEGELLLAAGRLKINAKLADDAKVKLNLGDDVSVAQYGDAVQLKAWYVDTSKPNPAFQRPGQAVAQTVNISLAKPPVTDKRSR